MTPNQVRADYEILQQIAGAFRQQAERIEQTRQLLRQGVQVLQDGEWLGPAATKLYAEMDQAVLPSMQRLQGAMETAALTTQTISQIMKQAEQAAAALFKISDSLADREQISDSGKEQISDPGLEVLPLPQDPAKSEALPGGPGTQAAGGVGTGPVKTDAQARAEAAQVLDYIKSEAQAPGGASDAITQTKFYQRLTDFYLKDYLAAPGPQTAEAAIAAIGKQLSGLTDSNNPDFWEQCSLDHFNKTRVPEAERNLFRIVTGIELPEEISAATDILSVANRQALPNIDVARLLGKDNFGVELEGGRNITQLMHWATGVRYSHLDSATAHTLFVGYEGWHQEALDVFGEDPLNDLIAEEAGRILATQLRSGVVTAENLPDKLNEGFAEARAWVGSLLRGRQGELDEWIVSEDPQQANWSRLWHGARENVWGNETVFTLLKSGHTVESVKSLEQVQRLKGIYQLIHEANAREKPQDTVLPPAPPQNEN